MMSEDTKNASIYPFVDDSGIVMNVSTKRPYKKRMKTEDKTKKPAATATATTVTPTSSTDVDAIYDAPVASGSNSELSAHYATKQTPPVGMPINLNNLTIHCLGEILPNRPNYHTEHSIYPAGFTSTRIYGHLKDPERKCAYTCNIIDNGDFPRYIQHSDIMTMF